MNAPEDLKLAAVGLGYAGVPLAVEFGTIRAVVGYDPKPTRIAALQRGEDATCEMPASDLAAVHHLRLSGNPADLAACNCYMIAVPTPVDAGKRP